MPDILFTFDTDDGREEMTYADYLKSPVLRAKVNDKSLYRLFLGREAYLFTHDYLAANPDLAKLLGDMEDVNRRSPLSFYAPFCQEQVDYLNDAEADLWMLVAPNRVGKTTTALIKMIIHAMPPDKTMWMFTKYGVNMPEWHGPRHFGVCTDVWRKHREVIWPEIRRWVPDAQLGYYAKTYDGRFHKDEPSWERSPSLRLKCRSTIAFYVYEQAQSLFESSAKDGWLWDEQAKQHLFGGADTRTKTKGGWHSFSLTPIPEEGRADTGAGSWINDIYDGELTYGHRVKKYHWPIAVMPDWLFPETQKEAFRIACIDEPQKSGDRRQIAIGEARYYGKWAGVSGLVYPMWNTDIHVIDPDDELLEGCTLYRGIDHGRVNPLCCLWVAVDRNYNHYIYRELYKGGMEIVEACREIAEMSGNHLRKLEPFTDERTGIEYQRWEEIEEAESFAKTVLDPRCFSKKEMGREIGWLYRCYGLRVQPASGKFTEDQVDAVSDLLRVDPEHEHPVTGEKGAPHLYIFRNTAPKFEWEIRHYVYEKQRAGALEDHNEKEKPRAKDDHAMSTIAYLAQIPMRYFGKSIPAARAMAEVVITGTRNKVTGY